MHVWIAALYVIYEITTYIFISAILHCDSTYLVGLNSPNFYNPFVDVQHVELVLLVEDGTPVRPGVVGQIQAWRVGLGKKMSDISQTCQRLSEKFEMIDFLKTDDVGVVSSNFFEHSETSGAPIKCLFRTSNKFIVLCSNC